jgi:hypothetical protein
MTQDSHIAYQNRAGRQLDCRLIAGVVVDMDDAREMIRDTAHRLVRCAYKFGE